MPWRLLPSYHRFAANRQRELKDSTVRHIRRRPEPAAVGLHNRAAYRQPHAHTVRLRCVEGLEEAVETTRIEPKARISHRHQHTVRIILGGTDRQLSRRIAHSTH